MRVGSEFTAKQISNRTPNPEATPSTVKHSDFVMKGTTKQANTAQAPGRLINIDGVKLHIREGGPTTANAGAEWPQPTAVIEAGCGLHSEHYHWLQHALARHFRVCSYDRAGLGWSDNHYSSCDAETIAAQLHSLLMRVGIVGPVLLVGHSIAGLYLRVYAHRYPDNVVGMVLLDASHPHQKQHLPVAGPSWRERVLQHALGWCAALGLTRIYALASRLEPYFLHDLPRESKARLRDLAHRRHTYLTPLRESAAFDHAANQALACGDLGELPLLVVTAGEPAKAPRLAPDQARQLASAWELLQQDLLNLSTNSRRRIIDGADHVTVITNKTYAVQVAEHVARFVQGTVLAHMRARERTSVHPASARPETGASGITWR